MKILIINPHDERIPLGRPTWTPLSIASAAAVLEESGCTVKIFDRLAHYHMGSRSIPAVNQSMISTVSSFKPDLILMEALSGSIYDTCYCIRDIRNLYDRPLGVFGSHVSAMPALTFRKIPQVDLLVEGEAEAPLAALVTGKWSEAPGVWLRNGDCGAPPVSPAFNIDMDSLPYPAFHLLDMDYYTKRSTFTIWCHHVSSATLMSSRGCNGKCAFCLESRNFGSGLRFRNLEKVVSDVKRTLQDYKINAIYFRDCNFLAHKSRGRDFCEMLIKNGLHRRMIWATQVRADCVDEELIKLMKRAGCCLLEFGVETPQQNHLDALGKTIPIEAAQRAIEFCRKASIHSHAYLMMGLVGETLADLEAGEAWVRQYKPSSFFWIKLQVFPGTPLYETHGESFFEYGQWDDREAVLGYFKRDLSAVDPSDREHWFKTRAQPLVGRSRRICQLKANSPYAMASLAKDRLSIRVRSLGQKIRGGASA